MNRATVLIIDDTPANIAVLADYLEGFCRVDHRKEKFSRNGTTPLKLDGPLPPVHKIGRRTTSHPRRRL